MFKLTRFSTQTNIFLLWCFLAVRICVDFHCIPCKQKNCAVRFMRQINVEWFLLWCFLVVRTCVNFYCLSSKQKRCAPLGQKKTTEKARHLRKKNCDTALEEFLRCDILSKFGPIEALLMRISCGRKRCAFLLSFCSTQAQVWHKLETRLWRSFWFN